MADGPRSHRTPQLLAVVPAAVVAVAALTVAAATVTETLHAELA